MINLCLCVWMEHELCSYHYILLDQGYVPGIFGVSHGALQFMAYEELKKGYSQYFGASERASERASECHSPHRIYNSLLRMRAIHELQMSIWGSNFMDFEIGSVYTITADPP